MVGVADVSSLPSGGVVDELTKPNLRWNSTARRECEEVKSEFQSALKIHHDVTMRSQVSKAARRHGREPANRGEQGLQRHPFERDAAMKAMRSADKRLKNAERELGATQS
jgi:hypothetical protein